MAARPPWPTIPPAAPSPRSACPRENSRPAPDRSHRLQRAGKTVSRMIPNNHVDDVRQRVAMQREFVDHVRQIQEINVQLLAARLTKKG